jgi:thiol-disulfide isomerase/thioredoxin
MTAPQPKLFPLWIPIVLVAALALAAGVAILAGGGDDDEVTATISTGDEPEQSAGAGGETRASTQIAGPTKGTPTEVGAVDVSGAALERAPQSGSDPAVGKPFPALRGQSVFDGSPVAIEPDGQAKLVLFVAHWCPHCQREVPRVVTYLEENPPPDGLAVYAVSSSVDPGKNNYPPSAWLIGEGWSYPTLADDAQASALAAAGVSAFPFFVAIDAAGNVVARDSGELSEDQLAALLDKLAG